MEDGTCSDRAADTLREDELVVFFRDGHHHQPEDVEECAGYQNPAGTEIVKEYSYDGTLFGVRTVNASLLLTPELSVRTPKNIMKISNEVIHVTVLVGKSCS